LPYAQSVLTSSYLNGRRKPKTVQRGIRAIRDINIYNLLMHAWCKQACHIHVFIIINNIVKYSAGVIDDFLRYEDTQVSAKIWPSLKLFRQPCYRWN